MTAQKPGPTTAHEEVDTWAMAPSQVRSFIDRVRAETDEQAAPGQRIQYGQDSGEQYLRVHHPPQGETRGLVVLVHGGLWRAELTLDMMTPSAVALAEDGWTVANIEYRRKGSGDDVRDSAEDLIRAIDEVRSALPGLEDAPRRLLGHSVGGTLAFGLAASRPFDEVIMVGAVCDLPGAAFAGLGGGSIAEFCGGGPDAAGDIYAAVDPLTLLDRIGSTTIRLVHGEDDDRIPPVQSRRLYRRATAHGRECSLDLVPGAGHFAFLDPASEPWGVATRSLRSD
ncbi:alpha/beta hydrolase family protein [Nitriliruptor alkaliphilus]|uniref:alpha/beta hydrolase family protein n=1 Tax=Nitriliruptor alkaliphilus TaxID=427918 RepID=UPI000698D262|nr:alpha/beta hydrolase [Nitriliruptor alkaliphilus]